ncbi:MAG: ComEC/Rec2 family competence protein, partial [Candidatus Weimeria sp.]
THLDDDHVSGLMQLLEKKYRINTVYLTKHIENDEKLERLKELCELNNTKITYLESADTLSCKYFTAEALFPDKRSDFDGANENSLVTVFTIEPDSDHPVKLIETGDISEEQEKYILEHYRRKIKKSSAGETLILKSAHHGSNNSNCSGWLSALKPDLILISAGKNNRYGHPGRDTIERINELGLRYLCTIDTGQIQIKNGEVIPFITQK